MKNYLVKHVRVDRVPVATVVGLSDGRIGVAICNSSDSYNKKQGRALAVGRALEGLLVNIPNREVNGQHMINLIIEEAGKMQTRVKKYFKNQVEV